MKIFNVGAISILVSLLVACGLNPAIVEYDASITSKDDHLPLPKDAPASVEITEIKVPRLTVDINAEEDSALRTSFTVEEIVDSLGQRTLKLNRNTATSWELVDQALNEQDIQTSDRNRSEYRFELGGTKAGKGFFKRLFTKKTEPLSLVLIPSGQFTVLSLESADDALPEESQVDRVFSALLDQWAE
jgi:hypothetical protein